MLINVYNMRVVGLAALLLLSSLALHIFMVVRLPFVVRPLLSVWSAST